MNSHKLTTIAALSLLTLAVACSGQTKTLHAKAFHAQQEKIIESHVKELVTAGRITDSEHFDGFRYLGEYGWYHGICDEDYMEKPSPCYFGAYKFSPAAFESAKGLYVIHGQMAEASDLLIDVGSGAFDAAVVGHTVGYLTYCELTGGRLKHCGQGEGFDSGATVIKFIDKNTVQLDRKAKWNADMYGLAIKPSSYINGCKCDQRTSAFLGPNQTPTHETDADINLNLTPRFEKIK